jgi:hypothetical protein
MTMTPTAADPQHAAAAAAAAGQRGGSAGASTMDKKSKQRRQKLPTKDELADADVNPSATPPGASFDTEAGRAAQGMRPDLGGPPEDDTNVRPPPDAEDELEEGEKTTDRK